MRMRWRAGRAGQGRPKAAAKRSPWIRARKSALQFPAEPVERLLDLIGARMVGGPYPAGAWERGPRVPMESPLAITRYTDMYQMSGEFKVKSDRGELAGQALLGDWVIDPG